MARLPKPWYRKDRREWYVTIAGTRHRLGPDKDEAERRFHELMAQSKTKAPEPPRSSTPGDQGLSVWKLFDKFLAHCQQHTAPRTYQDHRKNIELFLNERAELRDLAADALRPFHVQEWVDRHPTWGPTYQRNCMVSILRPYRWAKKQGYISVNPLAEMQVPVAERREAYLTPEQWQQIRGHYPDGDPFRDLLEFCWETGCRPYEARTLEIRHLALDKLQVIFPTKEGKGKKLRIIYLTTTALTLVQQHSADRTEGLLFLNRDGNQWTADAMNCRFYRLKEKTGIKFFSYEFRHGFATRKLVEGHNTLTVAALMGHSSTQMLERVYGHLTKEEGHLRKALGDGS